MEYGTSLAFNLTSGSVSAAYGIRIQEKVPDPDIGSGYTGMHRVI